MSILSRRAGRALSAAALPFAAAALFFVAAPVPEVDAAQLCRGGQIIKSGGSFVGCLFPTWGPNEQSMCNGAVYVPPDDPAGCHVCVLAPLDKDILDPGKWSSFTPSDFSCRLQEQDGPCEDGRFCDQEGCRELDDPYSIVMCQCELANAACGVGECVGGGYCEGSGCDFPVCYSPDTDISRALCGGASISAPECTAQCQPHTEVFEAGVDDDFAPGNGAEAPAPSDGLLGHIVQTGYLYPGSRDLDEITYDRWFGHTFTGFAPAPGEHICGARLVTRVGHGQGSLSSNDSLGLFFVDPAGHAFGSSFGAALSSFGITGGSSALITLDLASLPDGQNLLAELAANGWLDMVVQDDSAVDFARLEIDYCCEATWTPWLERDYPSGYGDYETLVDFLAVGQACPSPIGVECQTTSGVDWTLAGEVYTCDPAIGGVCVNADQPDGACMNYRVRFLCP